MNCIFCDSASLETADYPRSTIFNNKRFDYIRCQNCELIFINPLPTAEDYEKMYEKTYHETFYFKEEIPDYSNWLKLIEPKVDDKKLLLDFGCGDAGFLRYFQKQGYDCCGVEYDPELVQQLKVQNPGIEFFTAEAFWSVSNDRKFSVIFLGDVLEHISTPADFLGKLKNKLLPFGIIAAQGPLENNVNLGLGVRKLLSFGKKLYKPEVLASHVPYHIFFSNARNQESIFKKVGFETIYYKVIETPWPYPAEFTAKPGKGFKFLVARLSIALSKLIPGRMGNRFLYLGINK